VRVHGWRVSPTYALAPIVSVHARIPPRGGTAGLVGEFTHKPSQAAPPVGRHQLHPHRRSAYFSSVPHCRRRCGYTAALGSTGRVAGDEWCLGRVARVSSGPIRHEGTHIIAERAPLCALIYSASLQHQSAFLRARPEATVSAARVRSTANASGGSHGPSTQGRRRRGPPPAELGPGSCRRSARSAPPPAAGCSSSRAAPDRRVAPRNDPTSHTQPVITATRVLRLSVPSTRGGFRTPPRATTQDL
jgi:hypothetical protein